MDTLASGAADLAIRIFAAAVILVIGLWIARLARSFLTRVMSARGMEQTLVSFLTNIAYAALVVVIVIAALGKLGFQTTSLIAIIGAAGLAVGLALQSSLANLAAGIMLFIFRPFRAGDVIEAAGVIGTVEELLIFNTRLKTGDNKTVYIPNGKLVSDNLVNYSTKGIRRLDLVVGIAYDSDIARAREVIMETIEGNVRALSDPAPKVAVLDLADSSINLAVRPWVNSADYWDLRFELLEGIKNRLDKEGISIPFPQRQIHLTQTAEAPAPRPARAPAKRAPKKPAAEKK